MYTVELQDGTVIYWDLDTLSKAENVAVDFTMEHDEITTIRHDSGQICGIYERGGK